MAEINKIEPFEPQLPGADDRRIELLHGYPAPEESEQGAYLRAYWRILRSRRWTVLSAVFVILTLATIYTVREKPVFEARSTLEIEQENPDIITVQQLFQLQGVTNDYLRTQYKILDSDSLARDVIGKLHLDQAKEFNPPKRAWPWETPSASAAADPNLPADAAHEQGVLKSFEAHLSVNPVLQSRLVSVSFDSEDPKLAASVVNTLVASYVQQNLQAHWDATQQASGWLSQQLDGLKIKLESSEDNLQQYAQANGLLFLESSQGQNENIVNQRLRELQDELTQAQADLYQKESLYHLVQAGDYAALPGVFDNKMMQDLTVKLAGLEQEKAQLAPNFNARYPKMEEIQSQIDRIQDFLKRQQQQAARHIQDEYLAAQRRVALVGEAFAQQQKQANVVAEKSVEYNILKREVDTNKQLYEGLLQRLKEAGVSAGLKASNIRVVDPAVPPVKPVKPRIALNLALGLLAGLICGMSLAFLQEHTDNTLKTPDDIEHFLRMPVLAMIPSGRASNHKQNGQRKSLAASLPAGNGAGKPDLVKKESGDGWLRMDSELLEHSPLSEAFRNLRTSVLLSTASRPPQSLVVVSAEPSEGKTTVCSNLAISLAQLGKRVLVVDGDMRRPTIHEVFHVAKSAGLVNYLTGESDWPSLVQAAGIDGLDCLVCGPVPPNPSELLFSLRMRTLIAEATSAYDLVLIDAPPLLNVADGRILSSMAEGTIMVVRGSTTPRELVRRAGIYISEVGGRLIGVVLNDVDLRRDGYYYSRYDYYYSSHPADGNSKPNG
ncbi:MAG TPA: polysaccharide biosynthesis tyrosine autokinase [Candidatus Acidoferrales bacterium]|nr:polysaccharide biosynthesis tyrosine autokinase [Candidatus Acidoferrales bacterium]